MDGDFVQLGGVSRSNFTLTGKWSSLGGNQVAEFSSGSSRLVQSSGLHWPTGIDWIKGTLGQRVLDSSLQAMSYHNAYMLGVGLGGGAYLIDKAGETSMFSAYPNYQEGLK